MVVEPMDPAVLADDDWSACYALHSAAHAERGTEPATLDAYRGQHDRALRIGTQHYWLARTGGQIIGKADLYFRTEERAVGGFALYVEPHHRRRGAARALLRCVFDRAAELGCERLDVGADSDAGRALCEQAGGTLQQELTLRVLELADTNWSLVDRWIAEGEARPGGACIDVFTELPVALADAYVALWTAITADVPLPAGTPVVATTLAERRKQEAMMAALGWRHITVFVREPDGTPSAMSNLLHDPASPAIVRQDLTGVHPDHRARGRAKWLKAALLRRLPELCPGAERITTNNADTNVAMVEINRKLGYVDRVRQTIYRFDVPAFRAQLG